MRYGHPAAEELLSAVAEFLRDEVVPATAGRTRFHARVAANLVSGVARELESRERHGGDEGGVGFASDAELAQAIASGDFDDRLPDVLASLRPAVLERVRVVNPTHLDPREHDQEGTPE